MRLRSCEPNSGCAVGQSREWKKLQTSFDLRTPAKLSRIERLKRERSSINLFRTTARYFSEGEGVAAHDDLVALMVLRHYGVPARLLDWSSSWPRTSRFAPMRTKMERFGALTRSSTSWKETSNGMIGTARKPCLRAEMASDAGPKVAGWSGDVSSYGLWAVCARVHAAVHNQRRPW
jgi:hypothetical protein